VGTDKACVIFKNSKNTFTRSRGGFAFTPSKRSKSEEREIKRTRFLQVLTNTPRPYTFPVLPVPPCPLPVPTLHVKKGTRGQGRSQNFFLLIITTLIRLFYNSQIFCALQFWKVPCTTCTLIYLNFYFMFDKS